MNIKGRYTVEHIRNGEIIGRYLLKNGITNAGLDEILDVMFRNQTQSSTWYTGLIDSAGFSAFSIADTMASHVGWTEFTDYDETTRQTWTPVSSGTGVLKNTSYALFTINATGTVRGFFIVDNSTISGTSGTLWSTAAFTDGEKAVVSGDVLKVQYQITAVAA